MRILVDGDACPVIPIIEKIAKKNNIEVIIFINTDHILKSEFSKIIYVSSGKDVADFALVNYSIKNDIVVTNDYGLASMALAKNTLPLSFSGIIYTNDNMESFMMNRYIGAKIRRSGKYTKGPSKRTNKDNDNFVISLNKLIQELKNE